MPDSRTRDPDFMPQVLQGSLDGADFGIGIVVARFNEFVTRRLLDGALSTLSQRGVAVDRTVVAWVPGAFEVPGAGAELLRRDDVDAVIGLGAVIRGDTAHFEFVARAATDGTLRATLDAKKPFVFGVLTVDTAEQALARAGEGPDNKGSEAALTAIEMADLYRALRKEGNVRP